MDTRRSCVAHPFREQANLTRSWRNGVALCRTSSSPRAFKSSHCRTRNATTEGPLTALLGGQVRASDPAGGAGSTGGDWSNPREVPLEL